MFLSLVQKRRSIRRYKDKPVEPEKIDRLILRQEDLIPGSS